MTQFRRKYAPTRFALLLGMVFIVSCTFFRAPGKDDCEKLLGRQQMVEILTDIYLLEGFIAEYQYQGYTISDSAETYYARVFQKHNLDPQLFEESLACYLLDRQEMDIIHEMMLNNLSIMEGEWTAPQLEP